jgi:hypothetical protein
LCQVRHGRPLLLILLTNYRQQCKNLCDLV